MATRGLCRARPSKLSSSWALVVGGLWSPKSDHNMAVPAFADSISGTLRHAAPRMPRFVRRYILEHHSDARQFGFLAVGNAKMRSRFYSALSRLLWLQDSYISTSYSDLHAYHRQTIP